MGEQIRYSRGTDFGTRISTAIEARAKELGTTLVPLTNRHDSLHVLGWVNPDGSFGGLNFRTVGRYTKSQDGEMHGFLVTNTKGYYGISGCAVRDESSDNTTISIEEPKQGVMFPQSIFPRSKYITEGRLNQIALIAERGRVEPSVSGVPIDIVVFPQA